MNNKSCCSLQRRRPATKMRPSAIFVFLAVIAGSAGLQPACAGDAPGWMHALVSVPLPAHDEKTDAVLLYAEDILNVQGSGKIKSISRRAYKILRPTGREYGVISASYDGETKITGIRGWCIPTQGKDYEVKDKEVVETALLGIENGELATDLRTKFLRIPAADPGNIVGYEIEHEDRPYVLEDEWSFQSSVPVREARYTLQLPPGWEYKTAWINYKPVNPTPVGNNSWQWVATDVEAVKHENDMPPWRGVAARMVVSLFPAGGGSQNRGFENWKEEGVWEAGLERGRRDPSPEIKQKVTQLTVSAASPVEKMRALALFVQRDIRYVAIELGIGGWQPHPAPDIFTHKYGDCKDKVTLMSSMLGEIGVQSYYVSINTNRGAVTPQTPASMGLFNHEIMAIHLPDGLKDDSLIATMAHPKLGKILFFDPTDEYTPFGQLRGELQGNHGLLVTPDGGELVELPQLPGATSGVERSAKLTLSPSGTLRGDVVETRRGDSGLWQRMALKSVTKSADQVKSIENLVSHSLATFQLTKASIVNLNQTDLPFGYQYSFVAENYAKTAGNLLLVRPRVLGNRSSDLLETKEPRKYPVEFTGPERDVDTFEITMPPGFEVDDLPPPVNADYSFASYHSKTEVNGNTLKYTRTFEVKELSVPLSKVDDLKKLYRMIAGDERNNAVLKPATH
jgi:transglutaminase-like putative cysteine protease